MKKINLNIKLKDNIGIAPTEVICIHCNKKFIINKEEKITGYDVAKLWIQTMIERSLNNTKVDPNTNQPIATKTSKMETIRRYNRVINKIYDSKNGIIEFDDDDFKWLNEKFHAAEIPIKKEISDVLVKISDEILKAEMEK